MACRRPACAHTLPAHQALARSWHPNSGVGWCREAGRGLGGGEDVPAAGTQSCSTGAISLQLRGCRKDGLAGGNSEGGSWQAAAQRSPTHMHTHSHTHHLSTLTHKHMHSHSHTDTHNGTLTPTHTVTHALSHTHTRVPAHSRTDCSPRVQVDHLSFGQPVPLKLSKTTVSSYYGSRWASFRRPVLRLGANSCPHPGQSTVLLSRGGVEGHGGLGERDSFCS